MHSLLGTSYCESGIRLANRTSALENNRCIQSMAVNDRKWESIMRSDRAWAQGTVRCAPTISRQISAMVAAGSTHSSSAIRFTRTVPGNSFQRKEAMFCNRKFITSYGTPAGTRLHVRVRCGYASCNAPDRAKNSECRLIPEMLESLF